MNLRLIPTSCQVTTDTHLRGFNRPKLERAETKFFRDYWSMACNFVDGQQPFLFITPSMNGMKVPNWNHRSNMATRTYQRHVNWLARYAGK